MENFLCGLLLGYVGEMDLEKLSNKKIVLIMINKNLDYFYATNSQKKIKELPNLTLLFSLKKSDFRSLSIVAFIKDCLDVVKPIFKPKGFLFI